MAGSLLAIPAFVPALVCPGYLAAWFADLHGFRRRSLVERLFWSLPLSIAVSTIASVLLGKFLSLDAVAVFYLGSGALWLAVLGGEWRRLRREGGKWLLGWRPLGGWGMMLALLWIAVAILSLIDIQNKHQLYMSVTAYDHAPRVNWTESVLRTGVPPANPLYYYGQAAPMRYYYFWNVVCAATARMTHLPVRAIFAGSCIWSGFAIAALIGLYLKHFLISGEPLRRRVLAAICLLAVTGLDICVHLWNLVILHLLPPGDLEWWSTSQIASWLDSFLWVPHHLASLVCCMLAWLLAWMAGAEKLSRQMTRVVLIAAALSSAFGLSIYVLFGFFLVMLAWGGWQIAFERAPRAPLVLAAGGAGAVIFLLPYLRELTHSPSGSHGGSIFTFAVREMFSPDGLLASPLFRHFAAVDATAARNLANLLLLTPGYCVELGFYLCVLLVYMVPSWRGGRALNRAQRSLLFLALATLPMISFLRSTVLTSNDFGWRAALLMQFPLLLLAVDPLLAWGVLDGNRNPSKESGEALCATPYWFRSMASMALVIGLCSSLCQLLVLRFSLPFDEAVMSAQDGPNAGRVSHDAYIASLGYAALEKAIPRDALVQYNPAHADSLERMVDLFGVDHPIAIAADKLWCGSELGGDPSGCPAMAAAIDALYKGAPAQQAQAACRAYGIGYMVVTRYDDAWKDRDGWVWTLRPVVSQEEFRALDCRH